jgi:hypothetical protein
MNLLTRSWTFFQQIVFPDPSSWTVNDVQEWLEAKGMADYREKFLSKQIDGPQLMELDNKLVPT